MRLNNLIHNVLVELSVVLMLFVSGVPLWSQQAKTAIPREDYKHWYRLSTTKLSETGEWVGFTKHYDEQEDTLVIQHTRNQKSYSFAAASLNGFISPNEVLIHRDSISERYNLKTGKAHALSDKAQLVEDMPKGWYAYYYKNIKQLLIRGAAKIDSLSIDGILNYQYAPAARAFLITRQVDSSQVLELISLDELQKTVTVQDLQGYKLIETSWQKSGAQLAYTLIPEIEESAVVAFGKLAVYNLNTQEHRWLPQGLIMEKFKGYQLKREWQNPLELAVGGSKVVFSYRRQPLLQSDEIPEIWHSTDPYLAAGMRYRMGGANLPRIALWDLITNDIITLTDDRFTKVVCDPDLNYAVVYDPDSYLPSTLHEPPVDLYLKNLKTGKTQLLETAYVGHKLNIVFSPQGRYLAYPRKGHVILYDLFEQKDELPVPWIATEQADLETSNLVAWYQDEAAVLLQGKYDLWKFDWKSKKLTALTQGRNSGIVHKLIKPCRDWMPKRKDALFVEMNREYSQGYAIIEPGKAPKLISFGTDYVKWPKISADSKILMYFSEAYNRPPALEVYHLGDARPQRLFQSNLQYEAYELPRQELIQYTNSQGDSLQGILRYPAAYDPQKKYPMVVYVYEKQSHTFNHYTNPGFYTTIGFNPANLVNRGYFVLQPDITYQPGETAISAADCIIVATEHVLQEVPAIDSERLGLVGHSFGGFETGFTVTQTDLFATAVAGAGIYDNPSFYLFIQDHTSPAYYQYEESQLRMHKNLFDDYQGYLDNSALYHAPDMNTPLLLWSGQDDIHVDFNQTLDFYMGLKRLQKPVTMLLYPKMGHSAYKSDQQKDLSFKIEHWLDHHLKDVPAEDWVR